MKKIILLLTLLFTVASFSQKKEQISFDKNYAESKETIIASIENYQRESTYILDIETADDLMVLDSTIINSDGKFPFYIEKVGKHLGSFKKINNKTGEKIFLQSVILNISKELKTLSITKIEVKSFAKTKGYEAWDNALSSYLPDVYFEVLKNDNVFYKSTKKNNMKPDLPFSWNTNNQIRLSKPNQSNPDDMFKIIFYDEDSYSDHDFMGGAQFSRMQLQRHFSKDNITETFHFKEHDFKVVIHYKWI